MQQSIGPDPSPDTTGSDDPDSFSTISVVMADDQPQGDHAPATPDIAWLESMLAKAATQLGVTGDLSVVIVRDDAMAELHQRFSGVASTTDVLTFDLREPNPAEPNPTSPHPTEPGNHTIEGELYICVDEAHRRAAEFNHDTDHELLLYAVHGLLHLIGHDDHEEEDYQRMHKAEDQLLTALGVGPVFHASSRASDPSGGAPSNG